MTRRVSDELIRDGYIPLIADFLREGENDAAEALQDLLADRKDDIGRIATLEATVEQLTAEVERLEAKAKHLLGAARALDDLCVCYRMGRHPSEKLMGRLAVGRELLTELREE